MSARRFRTPHSLDTGLAMQATSRRVLNQLPIAPTHCFDRSLARASTPRSRRWGGWLFRREIIDAAPEKSITRTKSITRMSEDAFVSVMRSVGRGRRREKEKNSPVDGMGKEAGHVARASHSRPSQSSHRGPQVQYHGSEKYVIAVSSNGDGSGTNCGGAHASVPPCSMGTNASETHTDRAEATDSESQNSSPPLSHQSVLIAALGHACTEDKANLEAEVKVS